MTEKKKREPRRLCNATSKRTGKPCGALAMKGSTKCYNHGGPSSITNAGPSSPGYKHGRYAKVVPPHMREYFERASNDSDLMSYGHEVMLVDARIAGLLTRSEYGESVTLWTLLQQRYDEMHKAMFGGGDARDAITAAAALQTLIRKGIDDWIVWSEIAKLVEQRRKLVESHDKRLVQLSTKITEDQLYQWVVAVLDIVEQNVSSKRETGVITARIGQLFNTIDGESSTIREDDTTGEE